MALVLFGSLVSKEPGSPYSSNVSANVRVNRTAGTTSWLRLVQTSLQRYGTDSVLTGTAYKVTKIRPKPDEDEKPTVTVWKDMSQSAAWFFKTICSSATTVKGWYQPHGILSQKRYIV